MKKTQRNLNKNYKIAIDGPAGSGKSTIAKLMARKLGFLYIDSGAMYRAVTLYLIENKFLNLSEVLLRKKIPKLKIDFENKNNIQYIYLNGKDVTKKIRTLTVNKLVSEVSARKVVRDELVKRQREFARYKPVVMDGRDIGSTVFKNADLKIYLTASSYIRAIRRKKDLKKLSEKVGISELEKQIQARDDYDSSRAISPLCKMQDAVVIDSTSLGVEQVIEQICVFLPSYIV